MISGTHYSAVIKRPVSSSYGMHIDFVLEIIISSFSCACLTVFLFILTPVQHLRCYMTVAS